MAYLRIWSISMWFAQMRRKSNQEDPKLWRTLIQLVKNPPAMQETPVRFLLSGGSTGAGIGCTLQYSWASLVALIVKKQPAMRETWVWTLGWEDPMENGMASHSSILAWRIPWTEEPGRLYSPCGHRVGHDWGTSAFSRVLLRPLSFILYLLGWCFVFFFHLFLLVGG